MKFYEDKMYWSGLFTIFFISHIVIGINSLGFFSEIILALTLILFQGLTYYLFFGKELREKK